MKNELKKYISRHPGYLIALIIAVIGGPFAIHIFFRLQPENSFFTPIWSAGEFLEYYGNLLASAGAIAGVFFTVRYTQANYRDDNRNSVLPVMTLTEMMTKHYVNPFHDNPGAHRETPANTDSENEDVNSAVLYEEYRLQKICFFYENGTFVAKTDLPKKERDQLKYGMENTTKENGVYGDFTVGKINIPLVLENVGNGTAINCRIGLNAVNREERLLRAIQLNPGETFYILIYAPDSQAITDKQFQLSMVYHDIYKNTYRQNFPMELKDNRLCVNFDINQTLEEKAQS